MWEEQQVEELGNLLQNCNSRKEVAQRVHWFVLKDCTYSLTGGLFVVMIREIDLSIDLYLLKILYGLRRGEIVSKICASSGT